MCSFYLSKNSFGPNHSIEEDEKTSLWHHQIENDVAYYNSNNVTLNDNQTPVAEKWGKLRFVSPYVVFISTACYYVNYDVTSLAWKHCFQIKVATCNIIFMQTFGHWKKVDTMFVNPYLNPIPVRPNWGFWTFLLDKDKPDRTCMLNKPRRPTLCGASCSVTSHSKSDAFGSCFSENFFNNDIATDSAEK